MAWRDRVRTVHASVSFYSEIGLSTLLRTYGGSRVLSVDVVEEPPVIAMARRVSECTVRVTNDLAVGSSGNRVPSMGMDGSEDPSSLVGTFMAPTIWEGSDASSSWRSTFIVDSVEATDSGATIHGLGTEVLLDRTFDEVGLSTSLTTSNYAMSWILDAMSACGFTRSAIKYPTGYNSHLPRAWDVEGSTSVGDVVRGIAAYKGLVVGATDDGNVGAVCTPAWLMMAYGVEPPMWPCMTFPEPSQDETAGTLVVLDPTDGTSRDIDLGNGMTGTAKVSVPYSSGMDATGIEWRTLRQSMAAKLSQHYSADLFGDPAQLRANRYGYTSSTSKKLYQPLVPIYADASDPYYANLWRCLQGVRIEHHYDGGFTQTVVGPMYMEGS